MPTADLQPCTGASIRQPPARCACGHAEASHNITRTGRRTACSVHTGPAADPCGCRTYTPKEAPE